MTSKRTILGIMTIALSGAVILGPVSLAAAHTKAKHHKTTKKHTTTTTKAKESGGASKSCLTSTHISTLAGTHLPAPMAQSSDGLTICNYNTTTTGANVVYSITPAQGGNAADLKTAAVGEAGAQGATAKSLSGFGTAAYIATFGDASGNVNGVATTILIALDKGNYIDITGDLTVENIEAIGKYVLTH